MVIFHCYVSSPEGNVTMEQVTTLHNPKHIPLISVPKVAANSCSLFQSKLLCWIELQQQSYHDAVLDRNGYDVHWKKHRASNTVILPTHSKTRLNKSLDFSLDVAHDPDSHNEAIQFAIEFKISHHFLRNIICIHTFSPFLQRETSSINSSFREDPITALKNLKFSIIFHL